jgi:hypothetical protein
MQEPRRIARRHRPLGDAVGRKVEIEQVNAHRWIRWLAKKRCF